MSKILLITINETLRIVGLLPPATLGQPYYASLKGYAGQPPYVWSVSGALPAGITTTTDSNNDLVFSGSPSEAGTFPIVVEILDSEGRSVSRSFDFLCQALPLTITGDLTNGTVGGVVSYSYTLGGGYGARIVTVYSGALPAGLSISTAGVVTGTYTTAGNYSWRLQVEDSLGSKSFLNDANVVSWPVLSVAGSFANTTYGSPLAGSPLTISGGDGVYTLSGSPYSGARPDGVTIAVSGSSLVATGNTTAAGAFAWTERVLSGDGQHFDVACSMEVTQVKDIYIGGEFSLMGGSTRNRIGSFTEAGSLTSFNPNANNNVYSISKQPDGKVLIGGVFSTVGGVSQPNFARLNSDGTLDTGFTPAVNSRVNAIIVQPSGKIVIFGAFNTVNGSSRDGFARLNSDGTLDATVAGGARYINSVALLSSGKMWIGGTLAITGFTRLARLNDDLSIDTSLTNPDVNNAIYSVAGQSDGKAVIGGVFSSVNGGTTRNRIARINTDGTVDSSFNPNSNGPVHTVAVQADGKILVGGEFTSIAGTARNRIARLNSDGTIDSSFNPNADFYVYWIEVLSDGKMLVAGYFSNIAGGAREKGARLNADGTLDTSFPSPVIKYPPARVIRAL